MLVDVGFLEFFAIESLLVIARALGRLRQFLDALHEILYHSLFDRSVNDNVFALLGRVALGAQPPI